MTRREIALLVANLSIVWAAEVGSQRALLPDPAASGFLPVDPAANASMFFAYYEAQTSVTAETPLVLWLQVSH